MQSEEFSPSMKEETLRTASRLQNFAAMPSIFPIRTAKLKYVPKYVDNFVKNEWIKNQVEKPPFIQQAYQNAVNIFGSDKSLPEYAPDNIHQGYQHYPQHIITNKNSF